MLAASPATRDRDRRGQGLLHLLVVESCQLVVLVDFSFVSKEPELLSSHAGERGRGSSFLVQQLVRSEVELALGRVRTAPVLLIQQHSPVQHLGTARAGWVGKASCPSPLLGWDTAPQSCEPPSFPGACTRQGGGNTSYWQLWRVKASPRSRPALPGWGAEGTGPATLPRSRLQQQLLVVPRIPPAGFCSNGIQMQWILSVRVAWGPRVITAANRSSNLQLS